MQRKHRRILFSCAGLAGLLLGSSIAVAGPLKSFTGENGLTFDGSPGAFARPNAKTKKACGDLCRSDAGCRGYSFDTATGPLHRSTSTV